jgi:exonuclease SbcC
MSETNFQKMHETYAKKVDGVLSKPAFRALEVAVRSGVDNFLFQKSRQESKMFDESWVKALDEAFPYLDKIVKNPRNFIKEEGTIVNVALAKRVTPQSIAHLASHTQFIRKVLDNGDIEPEKILSVNTEEDFQIYENRFVATLILKLVEFVQRRYTFIQEHLDTKDTEVLVLHCVSLIDGVTFEIDDRLKLSRPSSDDGNKEKNEELLTRINKLRGQLLYYEKSLFMKNMQGFHPVRNPISQTNMIVKNPDYRACYKLWCFLDKYDRLGVEYSVSENNKAFSEAYINELYAMVLGQISLLESNLIVSDPLGQTSEHHRTLVPKIRLSLEDETFLDKKFAYHEFPEAAEVERSRKEAPKTPEEIRLQEADNVSKAWEESQKIEEIRSHEAERAKAQELYEAAENAKLRKKRQKELAAWEIKVAKKARDLIEKDMRKAEAKRKKAEKAALLKEKALLAAQRRQIKEAALRDRRIDLIHQQQLEKAAEKAAKLEASSLLNKGGNKA